MASWTTPTSSILSSLGNVLSIPFHTGSSTPTYGHSVYYFEMYPELYPEQFALLRDALAHEGFQVTLSEDCTSGIPEYTLVVGHRGREPSFSLCGAAESLRLKGPDGVDNGLTYSSVEEAAHAGFEEHGPIPSWELIKYPTLWQYIMNEG